MLSVYGGSTVPREQKGYTFGRNLVHRIATYVDYPLRQGKFSANTFV